MAPIKMVLKKKNISTSSGTTHSATRYHIQEP